MSDSFSTVLVQDPRLMVTDSIKFAVLKGGQNITESQFNAISASSSQMVFNIAVPSENTIIDRRVELASTVNFVINTGPIDYGSYLLKLGSGDGFQSFPLQGMMSTITATINNTTVALNCQDLKDIILLMNENSDLYRYHSTTPAIPDCSYLTYNMGIYNNNILGTYNQQSLNGDYAARGGFPFAIQQIQNAATGTVVNISNNLRNTYAGGGSESGGYPATSFNIFCSARFVEPLLISPFLFGDSKSAPQGFYGIQNMNFQFNVANLNRFWSTSNTNLTVTLNSTVPFQNTQLMFTFITPQPSQMLKSKNVVPFYQLFRYISTQGGTASQVAIAPSVYAPTANSYSIPGIIPTQQTYTSSTIQLNAIPDFLIIIGRVPLSTQTPANSASFLVINRISINFANCAGLLSNATQYDLYKMSVENGSSQTWENFSGWAMTSEGGYTFPAPTTGSMLVLRFGKDIQLSTDYWAPGSLGNFSLNYSITFTNQGTTYPTGVAAGAPTEYLFNSNAGGVDGSVIPEILTVTMDSGSFVCSSGTSNVYTGLLSREDVLNTSLQQPYTRHDISRLVGGSLYDKMSSSVGEALASRGHHRHHAGGSLGEAISGGLGSAISGGASHHKLSKHVRK